MTTAAVRARAAARRAMTTTEPEGPRPVLTGRAVVLGLVLAMLVFTLAVPARALFGQRAEIAALRADAAATGARIADLQDQQHRLADPAYVESLIRTRLHYVMPGEIGYTVLEPGEAPAPGAVDTTPDGSWYGRLWSSVQVADGDPALGPDGSDEVVIRPDAPR